MSDSESVDAAQEKDVSSTGSMTSQHVSGAEETGTFTTDQAPTEDTPIHGSSNAGINRAGGNRFDDTEERGTHAT